MKLKEIDAVLRKTATYLYQEGKVDDATAVLLVNEAVRLAVEQLVRYKNALTYPVEKTTAASYDIEGVGT